MRFFYLISFLIFFSCAGENATEIDCADCEETQNESDSIVVADQNNPSIIVLGTCQDAGSPQINCQKDCCKELHKNPDLSRQVVSLGLVIPEVKQKYIFEATPDFPAQINDLKEYAGFGGDIPDGVFLTHAHIGHYTGLMYLGKEATDASNVPVFAMPRMKAFLENNGPWDLLVERENIQLTYIEDSLHAYMGDVQVYPFLVPHRDEYSETVGYRIDGPNKSAIFIPDIDKWNKWEANIVDVIQDVDYAFLDATFFDAEELNNRDMSEIPHPFIVESMELFKDLSSEEKSKIIFIHFNHTNPVLNPDSDAYQSVTDKGFKIAQKGDIYTL